MTTFKKPYCSWIKSFGRLVAFVAAFALSCSAQWTFADAKQDITDARQETQIWTTYALSPYLRANDLKVAVHEGKATLTGSVEEDVNKESAKQIALGVDGIKEVDNQIVVKPDYKPTAKYGYGEAVDDVTINAAVKARLVWSKYSYISTKVETKDGQVTLTGEVDSADAKKHASRLALSTRGVRGVNNKLTLDEKSSAKSGKGKGAADNVKGAAQNAEQKIEDAWITTKVKSNFFYSSNVSGSDIDVDTRNGVVSLKGKVANNAERALAIEMAENIRGVKSVDSKGLFF